MQSSDECLLFINSPRGEAALGQLSGRRPEVLRQQQARYTALVERFRSLPTAAETVLSLFSSPGRTEICGNHTDHNAGRVLAAAVDLDIIAAAARTSDGLITPVSYTHLRAHETRHDLV